MRMSALIKRIFNTKQPTKEEHNMCFSEQIVKMRKQNHLTQEELANKLGLTFQAVSKWETGQSYPDITLLPTLADIFGCSIDALFEHQTPVSEQTPAPQQPESELLAPFAQPVNPPVMSVETLPWEDDNTLRVAVFEGHKYVGDQLPLTEHPEIAEYTFIYEGTEPLNIASNLNLSCGNVAGDAHADGNLTCTEVNGDASANGNLECGSVGGDANANGNLTCAAVGEGANAGGNLNCTGDIGAEVSAGGHATVNGSISGDVTAGGNVTAGVIEGEISAGGSVRSDTITGDYHGAFHQMNADMQNLGAYISNTINGAMEQANAAIHNAMNAPMQERQFGDKSKFHADRFEGNVVMGYDSKLKADSVSSESIMLGDGSSLSADRVQGTVSMQSGAVRADRIDSLAIVQGEIHADHIGTVVIAAGGSVGIQSENQPKIEYRNDI